MKAAVAYLEPHMEKADAGGKGRVVIGTVKGDVHDIGKNLVDIILTNNGYEVHNIGIKAPLSAFVEKANEVDADAIGMSGLLVKSTLIMRENLQELNDAGPRRDPRAPRRRRAHAHLRRARPARGLRRPPVLRQGRLRGPPHDGHPHGGQEDGTLDPDFGRALGGRILPPRKSEMRSRTRGRQLRPRAPTSPPTSPMFTPPFLGSRVAKGISLDDIAAYINETALFRNQWQFRPDKSLGENDAEFKERIRPTLRARARRGQGRRLAGARGDLGLLPGQRRRQRPHRLDRRRPSQRAPAVHVPAPAQRPPPLHRRLLPPRRSPATPTTPPSTSSPWATRATERERELFAADKYQEYLLTHGLSVEMTEALAELWHRRIREEWGFVDEDGPSLAGLFRQQYRGSRYSWGYPACPDLDDQAKLDDLLELHRIGVKLTEEFQLEPEQSTSAIIVPHPEAKYFVV